MNLKIVTIILTLFLNLACSHDSDMTVARGFLDSYYVMADQHQSLPLTQGLAKSKISKEIELLTVFSQRQDSYRSRDIMFEIVRSQITNKEATYFFELTIEIPNLGERKQLVNITVDRESKKVKYFGEVR